MNILFLGGDKRYEYMMCDLSKNHSVYQVGFDDINNVHTENPIDLDLTKFDVVLFPISGLNDNLQVKTLHGLVAIPSSVLENISENTIFLTGLKTKKLLEFIPLKQIVSFLDFEDVELINNSLTVEGVMEDIKDKNTNSVCILGYGKLGKDIYWKLKKLGSKVYVISRPKEQIFSDNIENYYPLNSQNIIEAFSDCNTIINTIPYNIIPEEALILENKPYILDIASFPYGIDENIIKKYKDKINYNLYLGIPSVFAPKRASEILLKVLEKEVFKT